MVIALFESAQHLWPPFPYVGISIMSPTSLRYKPRPHFHSLSCLWGAGYDLEPETRGTCRGLVFRRQKLKEPVLDGVHISGFQGQQNLRCQYPGRSQRWELCGLYWAEWQQGCLYWKAPVGWSGHCSCLESFQVSPGDYVSHLLSFNKPTRVDAHLCN